MRYLIGVGNYIAGDDAIGLRIVEEITTKGLEDGFRAVDLSSNMLDLVSYLTPETEAVLIVDSAKMGLAPGDVRFFAPEETETKKVSAGASTHEGDLIRVLDLVRAMGYPVPRLRLMGIEPGTVEPGTGLSDALRDQMSAYVTAAADELKRM